MKSLSHFMLDLKELIGEMLGIDESRVHIEHVSPGCIAIRVPKKISMRRIAKAQDELRNHHIVVGMEAWIERDTA